MSIVGKYPFLTKFETRHLIGGYTCTGSISSELP